MKYPLLTWALKRPVRLLPVFFLLILPESKGQILPVEIAGITTGRIHSVAGSTFLAASNPAHLGDIRNRILGCEHARPFLTREIGISSLSVTAPVHRGCFRLDASNFGIRGFRNFQYTLGFGMKLGAKLSGGVHFAFYHTATSECWNYLWAAGVSGGMQYQIQEHTRLGVFLQNPAIVSVFPLYGPVFPSDISLGISHLFYNNTWLVSEVSLVSDGQLQCKVMLEYLPAECLLIRSGFHSGPGTLFIAIGYKHKSVIMHVSIAFLSTPGLNPASNISYVF